MQPNNDNEIPFFPADEQTPERVPFGDEGQTRHPDRAWR